jgi:hypothetical protein
MDPIDNFTSSEIAGKNKNEQQRPSRPLFRPKEQMLE